MKIKQIEIIIKNNYFNSKHNLNNNLIQTNLLRHNNNHNYHNNLWSQIKHNLLSNERQVQIITINKMIKNLQP